MLVEALLILIRRNIRYQGCTSGLTRWRGGCT